MPHDDLAVLGQRVVLVVEDPRERIREYRQGLLKCHPMFRKVAFSLPRVPFKLQSFPSLVRYHKEEKNKGGLGLLSLPVVNPIWDLSNCRGRGNRMLDQPTMLY